jgi:subfamily B ATP-binding cassette protein MsbA
VGIAFQVKRFSNRLRKLVYERYLSFGKLFFDQHNVGYLYQVLTGYTAQIAQQLDILNSVLFSVFSLTVYFVIMLFISWPLTIFVVVVSPVLYFSVEWLFKKIRKTSESYTESYNRLAKNIMDALICIPLVKAYTNERKEKEWFDRSSDLVEGFEVSIDKKQMLIGPIQEIVVLSLVLVLVGFMAFLVIREKMGEIAGYLMFLIILRRAAGRLGSFNTIQASLASVKGPILEVMKVFEDKDKHFVPDGPRGFKGLKEKIEFNHLNFTYLKGVQALKDITFSIGKGKTTAIVGPSGAGKTTLIHLMMRFYDSPPSSIKIDGVDIRDFSVESLRKEMAMVSQDTLLFNASFRENVSYGLNGRVSDREIDEVIEKAKLKELISKLPQGLETEIGDRGVKLSGGEKQRLALARAILKGAEILILDEATSALDTHTEKLIQAAIDEAIKGKTAIVIAHRLSTIKHADRIVVIEGGKLVEEGSLNELLDRKGKFYQYWEAQKFY